MAITTSQIDALPSFTPAQMLTAVEYAIVMVSVSGQSYSINGRSFSKSNLSELKKLRDDLKAEVDAAASSSGRNAALADFSDQ